MATRNVVYQFEDYFVAYDRNTESEAIAQIEAEQNYIDKFDVNMDEREIIDGRKPFLEIIDNELVVREVTIFDAAPGSLIPEGN